MARPNNLESYWMPFSANRDFKSDPRLIVSAKGIYYKSEDGRDILDSSSGLWCSNIGHSHPKIVEAIRAQVGELDYAPSFNFSHPKAFELANRLSEIFPAPVNHFFYTGSGSESVDTALKIALAYQRARGKGSKTRLIGRELGYHGVGFGGISVGGMVKNRMYFGTLLAGVDHMRSTFDLERNAYTKGLPEHGVEFAEDLSRIIALHDASTIAAVIVEPVSGSSGVFPPPKGYLERLRALCDEHDILLIFDEVITAFGRLGKGSGAEYFGVTPDLIATAKGLTAAAVPMGAVGVQDKVYDTIVNNSDTAIELFHGYTYGAHPMATAAALAALQIYQEENLFERATELALYWEEAIHSLKGLPHIIDIRNVGLMGALHLESRKGDNGARGSDAMKLAWKYGMMQRVNGDILAFAPPLICEKEDIDTIITTAKKILQELA